MTSTSLMRCNVDGTVSVITCPGGCVNNECVQAPQTCTETETQCLGDSIQMCQSNTWVTLPTACENGCENGACRTACTGADPICVGDYVSMCQYGAWQKSQVPCENGCENGACRAICTEGAMKCDGDYPVLCSGGQWNRSATSCVNGCENGTCRQTSQCSNGAKSCNGDFVSVCVSGVWQTEGEACPNGCLNGVCKSTASCSDTCKDGTTLLHCESDGSKVEQSCHPGRCNEEKNACEAPNCTDGQKQCDGAYESTCQNGEWTRADEACELGCNETTHRCNENYTQMPTACTANTANVCLNETTSWTCSDWWTEEPKLYKQHCAKDRACVQGNCVVPDETKCEADYCKDLHTLVKCTGGVAVETECPEGELCGDRQCRKTDIKTCTSNINCLKNETCFDGLCYTKELLSLEVGAPCSSSTFEEYCKGDTEYYCSPDGVVEENDCSDYNGCSLILQKIFRQETLTRNASCRGESEELKACTRPGLVLSRCFNSPDEYWSIYMSLSSVCVKGTDGRMVYQVDREEAECATQCNEETGYCYE